MSKTLTVTQKKKDAIILSKDKFEVDDKGGKITIELKSNVNYTATVSQESSSWISKVVKSKSLSDLTEEFMIEAASTEGSREGKILFVYGELKDTVYVFQKQKDQLILSEDTIKLDNNRHNVEVDLSYNLDYNIIIPDKCDWVTLLDTKAVREDKIAFMIKENTEYDNRSAKIVVTAVNSNLSDTLIIEQSQLNALILSNGKKLVDSKGGAFNVELKSNVDYDIIMPLDVSWVEKVETKGLNIYNIAFNVEANNGDKRECEVIFKDKGATISDTLFISQKGVIVEHPYITILSKELTPAEKKVMIVAKGGGVIKFNVDANVDYKLHNSTFDSTWIKEKSKLGNEYEFYIAKNTGNKMVMGAIYAENKERKICDTLNIFLLPNINDYYINISKTSYTIPWRSIKPTDDEHWALGKDYITLDIKFTSNDLNFLNVDLYNDIIGSYHWVYRSWIGDPESSINKTIRLEFDRNLSGVHRSCKLVISAGLSGEVKKEIIIKQEPAPVGYPNSWNISVTENEIKNIIRERDIEQLRKLNLTGSLSYDDMQYISTFKNMEFLDIYETTVSILSLYGVGLNSLKSIKLPNGLKEIDLNCFRECYDLTSITLPDSLIKIGQGAFARSGIRELFIPSSVRIIKRGAFENSALQKIVFADGSQLEEADSSFGAAYSLMSVKGVSYIGNYMFYNCGSLVEMIMSDNLKTMGVGAFGNCSSLPSLTFPEGFNHIPFSQDNDNFKNCTSLKSIYSLSNNILGIGNYWNILFEDVNPAFALYVTPIAY